MLSRGFLRRLPLDGDTVILQRRPSDCGSRLVADKEVVPDV